MKEFLYFEPESLEEAVTLVNENVGSMPLSGGTDLIRRMRKGMLKPAALINLNKINALKNISFHPAEGLKIGAGVTIAEIEASRTVFDCCPAILEIAQYFGTPQVRNVATMAGNICNGSPASDYPPLLLALNASVCLQGRANSRKILLADLYMSESPCVFEKGEILTEIIIPPLDETARVGCARHTTRDLLDIGIISLAVYAELIGEKIHQVRIGLGSLAPTPVRAYQTEGFLEGKIAGEEIVRQAAEQLLQDIQPIDDFRASADYRKVMVQTYFKRVFLKILA